MTRNWSVRAPARWLAMLAILALMTGVMATSVMAAPSFTFTPDDQGANDEPGQKDLTAQSAAFDGSTFYTAWKWDDTSWSGNNTGDACSLFDTDNDGNVNYAVCATIGGQTPVLKSVTVYSCSDGRPDRCTNPVLLRTYLPTTTTPAPCEITRSIPGQFQGDPSDTLAVCNISRIASDLSRPELNSGTLLNTCSYPSREPNSDPSDCVLTVAAVPTTTATQVKKSSDNSDIVNDTSVAIGTVVYDTATLGGQTATAGGMVSYFYLKQTTTTPTCTGGTSLGSVTVFNGIVPPSATKTLDAAGTYEFWAVYSGDGVITGSTSPCGSETVIVVRNAVGIGTAQSFVPNDTATLTGSTSGATGTITFKLYPPSDTTSCTGTNVVFSQTVSVANGTASTNNTIAVTDEGTYKWLVVYSGDDNNAPVTSACGDEYFTLQN